ncbi:KAP family P-loop NTPase fold protein [Nocardia alni]|uniref:KAP family P-loop NTPase fold protein n=1 Tax=Nocardia alni TaxID=2815723 RepID=UPI001C240102|nr:P-loop NTPase fold protein [Nocardia alni]
MSDVTGIAISERDSKFERFVVLNDAPVGDSGNEDLLDLAASARRLGDLIVASRSAAPFTLAIDADWGMGKSSLMRQLQAVLDAAPGVTSVWFNAWTAGSTDILEGLIKSVLLSLDPSVIRRTVRSLSKNTQLLNGIRVAFMLVASFFGLGGVVDQIWKILSTDAKSRNAIKSVLRDALDTWMHRGDRLDGGQLLVVFIDDLDRCASERIIEICQAIKLYLDVPGIVFVMACDQSVLLKTVHASDTDSNATRTLAYLEKIIQINYRIPAPSTSDVKNLINGYLARSGAGSYFDETMKSLVARGSGHNPRRIKRLINSFVVEYGLNPDWAGAGIENLIRVVLLQQFYPDFYRSLVSPDDGDPIQDFLAYYSFRMATKQGTEIDYESLHKLCENKDVRPPPPKLDGEKLEQHLKELEQNLPLYFPELATDREFTSLIKSLDFPAKSYRLRYILRRPFSYHVAPPVSDFPDSTYLHSALPESLEADAFQGLHILRIDDQSSPDSGLNRELEDLGAHVNHAVDRSSASLVLEKSNPDIIVSDITRFDDPNAGLDDMEYFRSKYGFTGPVVFYTGAITPARRTRVSELGSATITNDPSRVMQLIAASLPDRLPYDRGSR